jgi:hypothetical protein
MQPFLPLLRGIFFSFVFRKKQQQTNKHIHYPFSFADVRGGNDGIHE